MKYLKIVMVMGVAALTISAAQAHHRHHHIKHHHHLRHHVR